MVSWRPLRILDATGKIGFLWINSDEGGTIMTITNSPNHPPSDRTGPDVWVLAYERVESGTVDGESGS